MPLPEFAASETVGVLGAKQVLGKCLLSIVDSTAQYYVELVECRPRMYIPGNNTLVIKYVNLA